ncbi:acyl-CoA dehydrogenase family protein [Patulibacter brassicae]|uniref:Acyl-[acyl-carrier-protein] dehydrogenase MbtN n=1 Tax=Patulibacter brassicae TaxID=1705717 RepID=A0ABU4VNR6_9ACTN|nr:acyl-CoA dehydrogenase family protein [Patulibacter brassicae]MDX8152704.1 acyl-CoA dehydrogenase family protein [Patulibacter brassicae]
MRRTLFEDHHDEFRAATRAFLEREAVPHVDAWEADGMVPRSFWTKAARQGLFGFEVPEEHGGLGIDDFRFNAIVDEEVAYANAIGDNLSLQSDILCGYLCDLATPEQQARWLPGFVAGELLFAIAMTEPGMGSDLRAMATTARPVEGGYVVDGAKTFITAGIQADRVIICAKLAAEGDPDPRDGEITLLVADAQAEGFTRGRKLEKVGRRAQDTAELFFDGLFVPQEDLLGQQGRGLVHLKRHLPRERLSMAVMGIAVAEKALEMTAEYCRERRAFGRPIGSHQANRFALADMQTEVSIGRVYVDRCIEALLAGELTGAEAAKAKLWITEMQNRVVDRCVQLHGGYGYMEEYPIARLWRDSRVQRIYGGTSEIMREIIGRSMGF